MSTSQKEEGPLEGNPKMTHCPLCGRSFTKGAKTSCSGCPLHYGDCNFEKCPFCGYDIPQGSWLYSLFIEIKKRWKGIWKP